MGRIASPLWNNYFFPNPLQFGIHLSYYSGLCGLVSEVSLKKTVKVCKYTLVLQFHGVAFLLFDPLKNEFVLYPI
jgi:hypothetical protein